MYVVKSYINLAINPCRKEFGMDLIGKKIIQVKQLPTIRTAQQIEQDVEILVIEFEDGSKLEVQPETGCSNPDDENDSYLQIKYKQFTGS